MRRSPVGGFDGAEGTIMSGQRPLIKGFLQFCVGRGCGHVFGLVRGE
jgi:hypothetical protein